MKKNLKAKYLGICLLFLFIALINRVQAGPLPGYWKGRDLLNGIKEEPAELVLEKKIISRNYSVNIGERPPAVIKFEEAFPEEDGKGNLRLDRKILVDQSEKIETYSYRGEVTYYELKP